MPARHLSTELVGALPIAPLDVPRLFQSAYPELRADLLHRRAGALIAMIDPDGALEGHVWIRARERRPRCAIIGRHARCAVSLPWATELSLRHVAVLVRAVGDGVEVRALDLLSGWGFFGEDGAALESITTDGTAFFRVGQHILAIFVTTGREAWPLDPVEAYRMIPDREVEDCRRPDFDAPRASAKNINTKVKQKTGVVRIPVEPAPLLDAGAEDTGLFVMPQDLSDEDAPEDEIRREMEASLKRALVGGAGPLGELVITTDGRHDIVPIGKEALERGILLGRYSRCARRGLTPFSNTELSRVHLLITCTDDLILAYDTASANGSWDRSLVANGVELSKGRVVRLGTGQAYVSWV